MFYFPLYLNILITTWIGTSSGFTACQESMASDRSRDRVSDVRGKWRQNIRRIGRDGFKAGSGSDFFPEKENG